MTFVNILLSTGVNGQESKKSLLQPLDPELSKMGHSAEPQQDKLGKSMRPLLQPAPGGSSTQADKFEKATDTAHKTGFSSAKQLQGKGGSHSDSTKSGSDLFGMVRATTPTPDPRRPTMRIKTGLLKPASVPESGAGIPNRPHLRPTKRPDKRTTRRPTRRPSKLIARVPTTKPKMKTTQSPLKTTRRPASLLSPNRNPRRTTVAPFGNYKAGAG